MLVERANSPYTALLTECYDVFGPDLFHLWLLRRRSSFLFECCADVILQETTTPTVLVFRSPAFVFSPVTFLLPTPPPRVVRVVAAVERTVSFSACGIHVVRQLEFVSFLFRWKQEYSDFEFGDTQPHKQELLCRTRTDFESRIRPKTAQ
jgi:hypothetical protein